ncbi:MAG: hypothetical protein JO242_20810 [Streptosporangiaceae bacterium]|nr:hypothetical protein [Streptosporangiaceae bacterium]
MSTINQRPSRKEAFWRQILRQWQSSGLSVRAFCAVHGLGEANFYAWRRTIAQRDGQTAAFVPVRVVPDPPAEPAADEAGRALELVVGRRRVRIGPGFDAPTLQRLLALLEEGPA